MSNRLLGRRLSLLIDLHNHTEVSSSCSRLSPEELIEEARVRSLDAICITEHATLQGAEVARRIGEKLNFPVFRGIEARTDLGDMLVYGWYRDIPDGTPLAELCELVLGNGGVIFAAHPFHTKGGWNLLTAVREMGFDLRKDWKRLVFLKQLTGIEIINGNVDEETNGLAHTLAENLGLPGIAGSDAHAKHMVGKAATRFSKAISSEAELVEALKSGAFEALRLRY